MKARYGSERWRVAAGTALAAVLAFALMGTVPLAFAEEEDDGPEVGVEVPEEGFAHIEDDTTQLTSAFRLGDVRLSVIAQDAEAAALALGTPVERTYLITNEGELAYVRLASSLVHGDFVHPNEGNVYDGELGTLQPEEDGIDEGPDVSETVIDENAVIHWWHLAKDGWWYRNEPLAPGESIAVRVLMELPLEDAWVDAFKTGAPSSVEETMSVEAVQARNMSIDPTAEHPWGDLEVEIPEPEAPEGGEADSNGPVEEGDIS